MRINKACWNCKFNFDGVCSGNEYDKIISDKSYFCGGWTISYNCFVEINDRVPWYILDMYKEGLSIEETIQLIDIDESGEKVKLNPIKVIKKLYKIKDNELSVLFNVSASVVRSAKVRKVPLKRKKEIC